jgi:acetyltransferase-like isoleucine patch superfamily enzyme/aryl carrier-like protein
VRNLYLCGVGNVEGIRLALRVNEALSRWERIVLLDDDARTHGVQKLGLAVSGSFDLLAQADPQADEVVNLVTRTTGGRDRARERIAAFGVPFTSLVHPDVDLLGTELANEVTIYQGASIGAEAHVGRSAVVLVGGVVGHGARIGEGCVIAPYGVVNARVKLGARVYVGSNASILPDLEIGEGATIAGNTLVVDHVPAHATAIGVPATVLDPHAASAPVASAGAIPEHPAPRGDGTVSTDLHRALLSIVERILGAASVEVQRNFFDAGGTSMKMLQLCDRVREELGVSITLVDVYRHPTVQDLSRFIGGHSTGVEVVDDARRRAAMRRGRLRL